MNVQIVILSSRGCPCLFASTESSCNNMFTKWPECHKNTCEWRNIYSTTKPDPHCTGGDTCKKIKTRNICNNTTYMPSTGPSAGQPVYCNWFRNFAPPFNLNYSCHQCISDGEQCSSMLPNGKAINPNYQCCSGSCTNGKCKKKLIN